ncbi:inositol monophosphatase family protein [Cryptosporangium aurantiacum]|uniref:Histidinol-phosphatase n=1 Tax=Cryptosporangium aurantiacum TaxID=134849 RepID=A0A1M7RJT4_9ACTN|nr:inositol monophosphatase [Cryptosporangium aurantiacum]SHN46406.1 histidinol-phosphatase [Cryptosporangium aurantiacum]
MTGWEAELDFARTFATLAGQEIRQIVANGYRVEAKADRSLVTTADRQINDRFISAVQERFPGDGVQGEEASHVTGGDRTWVIDPVDGTQQLILGIPVFMVSIALVLDGRPVVAVAHNPSTRESYWAGHGGGAYRDGTPLTVSAHDGVTAPTTVSAAGTVASPSGLNADGLLRVTTGAGFDSEPRRFPWPSVFSGCKVAEGAWDADLYSGTAAHDVAAVCLLVREAGGTVTDRTGADQRYDRPVNGCLLSNGAIHEALAAEWNRVYVPR